MLSTVLLLIVVAVLVWSGIHPADRFTWWLEVAPVLIGLPIVILTNKRFPLTPLLQVLLTIHAIILMIGGGTPYAEVPIGFWFRDALGLARNHYDRLGHFAQGFVPAILAREILWWTSPPGEPVAPIRGGVDLPGFQRTYELIEWFTAEMTGRPAFLGTQEMCGIPGDMFMASWAR